MLWSDPSGVSASPWDLQAGRCLRHNPLTCLVVTAMCTYLSPFIPGCRKQEEFAAFLPACCLGSRGLTSPARGSPACGASLLLGARDGEAKMTLLGLRTQASGEYTWACTPACLSPELLQPSRSRGHLLQTASKREWKAEQLFAGRASLSAEPLLEQLVAQHHPADCPGAGVQV